MAQENKKSFEGILKLCTWHYRGYCMADSGDWGQVRCNGDCVWPEQYKKLIEKDDTRRSNEGHPRDARMAAE